MISAGDRLADAYHLAIEHPFDILDLISDTGGISLSSSPGVDGIPYTQFNVLFKHSDTVELAVTVFN